jgi:hypothetical protein
MTTQRDDVERETDVGRQCDAFLRGEDPKGQHTRCQSYPLRIDVLPYKQ